MLPAFVLVVAGVSAISGVRAYRHRARKPQAAFKFHPTDNSDAPFAHWSPSLGQQAVCHEQQHPYESVINALVRCPTLPDTIPCNTHPPCRPPPLEDTPLVMVTNVKALRQLARELMHAGRFAVDMEHNSLRSYLGLSCLLQISTGVTDYIVDVLALHDHMHLLRSAFADPGIVKVLHGGAGDVMWLQRDFHLYLVNLFDTERACMVLGREERSLAHLLRRYCGVQQDKAYQRADWRVRPLSAELIHYARSDVHWLLYIADCLTAELLQGATLKPAAVTGSEYQPSGSGLQADDYPELAAVLRKSHAITAQLYRKPDSTSAAAVAALFKRYCGQHMQYHDAACSHGRMDVHGAAAVSRTTGGSSGDEQGGADDISHSNGKVAACSGSGEAAQAERAAVQRAIIALAEWRDVVARADDESPQYVLPDAALLELASTRPVNPKDVISTAAQWVAQLNRSRAAAPFLPEWHVSAALRRRTREVVSLLGAAGGPGSQPQLPVAADGEVSGVLHLHRPVQQQPQPQLRRKGGRTEAEEQQFTAHMIKKFAAKHEVYQNCRMLSQEGQLLCFCDEKKLRWYVEKGLADVITEQPPTIKLRFEHKTTDQATGVDGFYSRAKANRCVCCGDESHFLRYRILPTCYRRCYPMHLKSHRSHDIVLLCIRCHTVAHKASERLKRQLAREYAIPLNAPKPTSPAQQVEEAAEEQQQDEGPDDSTVLDGFGPSGGSNGYIPTAVAAVCHTSDGPAASLTPIHQEGSSVGGAACATVTDGAPVSAFQARAAAVALRRFGDSIPEPRREELEGHIRAFLGKDAPGADLQGLSAADVQAALMAGISPKKRSKLCRKLQLTPSEVAAAEAAAASGEAMSRQGGDAGSSRQLPGAGEPGGAGHTWHGERLVAKALAHGGEEELLALIRRFRQCFVHATQPRFLPTDWSVQVVAKREFGDKSVYHAPSAHAVQADSVKMQDPVGSEQERLRSSPSHELTQPSDHQQHSLHAGLWPVLQA